MSLTTDRTTPCLHEIDPITGQQKCYLILSDEERAKGFVRPVRQTYRHVACETNTTMGLALAETYARNPAFYGGTFCCHCRQHFPLVQMLENDATGQTFEIRQFQWIGPDGKPDGSFVGE